jgi:hypothetical protein
VARAAATDDEPDASGMVTAHGPNRPSIDWTASTLRPGQGPDRETKGRAGAAGGSGRRGEVVPMSDGIGAGGPSQRERPSNNERREPTWSSSRHADIRLHAILLRREERHATFWNAPVARIYVSQFGSFLTESFAFLNPAADRKSRSVPTHSPWKPHGFPRLP